MTGISWKAAALSASLACFAAAAAAATQADVQAHVDKATRAAGQDLKAFLRLCQPAPVDRPVVSLESLAAMIATPGPEPQAAFDNLYYLGSG